MPPWMRYLKYWTFGLKFCSMWKMNQNQVSSWRENVKKHPLSHQNTKQRDNYSPTCLEKYDTGDCALTIQPSSERANGKSHVTLVLFHVSGLASGLLKFVCWTSNKRFVRWEKERKLHQKHFPNYTTDKFLSALEVTYT